MPPALPPALPCLLALLGGLAAARQLERWERAEHNCEIVLELEKDNVKARHAPPVLAPPLSCPPPPPPTPARRRAALAAAVTSCSSFLIPARNGCNAFMMLITAAP